MDIRTMMEIVGEVVQRLEEESEKDAVAIRELALRVQVLEDRLAALASHDTPSVPPGEYDRAVASERRVAYEADEQVAHYTGVFAR